MHASAPAPECCFGSLEFQEQESATAYDDLLEKATTADAQVNAAVGALGQTISKG